MSAVSPTMLRALRFIERTEPVSERRIGVEGFSIATLDALERRELIQWSANRLRKPPFAVRVYATTEAGRELVGGAT